VNPSALFNGGKELMQTVKCPFCFVFLDVSHLPPGQLLQCPSCSSPIRVAGPRRWEARHYILGGAGLGLVIGVAATVVLMGLFKSAPVNFVINELPSVLPDKPAVPADPDASPDMVLDIYGASANEAASILRKEFGPGAFSMLEAKPWLIALEIGRYSERPVLQMYERALTSLHESFQKQFASLRLPPPTRAMTVVILNSRESFDTYCRRRHGGTKPPTVMGFYEFKERRTVTYHEGFLPVERMLHEGTHQLVHYYSTAPFHSFWFHEGLGSAFETYTKVVDGPYETVVAKPAVNHPRLYEALRALNDADIRSYVSVHQLMALSMDSFQAWWDQISREAARDPRHDVAARLAANRDKIANAYYSVSWAIVYYMMNSDPAYADVLTEYFVQETRGKGGRDTFEIILKGRTQQDLDQFQANFVKYIADLK
jgi:hypothetical protein